MKELEVWVREIHLRACVRIGELSRELDKGHKIGQQTEVQLPASGKLKAEAGISTSTAHRYEEIAGGPKRATSGCHWQGGGLCVAGVVFLNCLPAQASNQLFAFRGSTETRAHFHSDDLGHVQVTGERGDFLWCQFAQPHAVSIAQHRSLLVALPPQGSRKAAALI